MQSISDQISQILAPILVAHQLPPALAKVGVSARPDLSDYQCNGALEGAKLLNISAIQLANQIVTAAQANPIFEDCFVAGPGFINFKLSPSFLLLAANTQLQDQKLGMTDPDQTETVVLDYGGATIGKPMHVGHLRSLVIGDAIYRLYKLLGHTVISDIHLGDWGTQMGMIISELALDHPEWPYFDPQLSGPYPESSPINLQDLDQIYPKASAACKADPIRMKQALLATKELQDGRPGYLALWRHFTGTSLWSVKRDIADLGIDFDYWYGESTVNPQIPNMLERLRTTGVLKQSEGAEVIFFQSDLTPFLIVKSDGAYLYSTSDLATIEQRVRDFQPTRIVYVVDARQSLHFKQLFSAVREYRLAPQSLQLDFAPFGTVNGLDGKPLKSRSGGAFKLNDLLGLVTDKAMARMQEAGISASLPQDQQQKIAQLVGVAALKFGDLINNRASDYIFDPERFTAFEGKTGPSVMYSAVRIQSIFEKGGLDFKASYPISILNPAERNLILLTNRFPEVVVKSAQEFLPSLLADYLYQLSSEYNKFYQSSRILKAEKEDQKTSWLGLSQLVHKVLKQGLDCLGIALPEQM